MDITSPAADGWYTKNSTIGISGVASNGTQPYTLNWDFDAASGANLATESQTQSGAAGPAPINVTYPNSGKKVTITVTASDSSQPQKTASDTISIFFPKFMVQDMTFKSDHGVMLDYMNDFTSGGQCILPFTEPEYSEGGDNHPISLIGTIPPSFIYNSVKNFLWSSIFYPGHPTRVKPARVGFKNSLPVIKIAPSIRVLEQQW